MALEQNALALIDRNGLNFIAFVTLTFKKRLSNPEIARRLKSLRNGVLDRFFNGKWLWVRGRFTGGGTHFHLLVVCSENIRSGFDFRERKLRRMPSANEALRKVWTFWREKAAKYAFGRAHTLPVRLREAVAGYMARHVACRPPANKGVRFVGCPKAAQVHTARFSFVFGKSRLYRKEAARLFGNLSLAEVKKKHGRYWVRLVFVELAKAELQRNSQNQT